MFWILLLLLINSFGGFAGAEHETLCTSNACFTLQMDSVNFEEARESCDLNGGYLMTVRDREEEDVLRSLLSQIQRPQQGRDLEFWIGLKLHRGDCVLPDKTLRGFKWVQGEQDSPYSNWGKEPVTTCTKERCVRVQYTLTGQKELKWTAGPCKSPALYVCKFYFKGMCRPLALLGPGKIIYTAPFSVEPERSEIQAFPLGTYAVISCNDSQSHYSVCMERDDIYRWSTAGPFCKAGKQSCEINNGGCEHLCRQEAGEVHCFCKEGYDLDENGLTCRIKNWCGIDTCEYQCMMGESGYSCKCPDGFKLDANLHSCSDIDECQSQTCQHHLCVNTPGSYRCECKDGYEMVAGECRDVEECQQSRCEHSCLNSVGSFSCFCHEGFTLSEDGLSCVDVDECTSGPCPTLICVNAVGSFSCTCPPGFHTNSDGAACDPDGRGTPAASSDDPTVAGTLRNLTESLTRTTVELQHQAPHTEAPLPHLVNGTHGDPERNASLSLLPSFAPNSKVIVCVLGSVIPLLLLVAVTLAIAIFRCSRSKKKAKKNASTDGYCWVSSGLDPRLEKLYESILTDDV